MAETNGGGHPDMDYAAHENTYEGFLSMFKWGTIAVIFVVIIVFIAIT
jgi:hypothetical protein